MRELNEARKMLLVPRAAWCSSELRRSAQVMRENGAFDVAEGTAFMADTLDEMSGEAARAARAADWLTRSSRYLLDMLTADNATVEAMYGKRDTLEQAAAELRAAVKAWESPDAR